MQISIDTKFPIEWDKEYYLTGFEIVEIEGHKDCPACRGEKLVVINNDNYTCPKCHGKGHLISGEYDMRVYYLQKVVLDDIYIKKEDTVFYFKRMDSRYKGGHMRILNLEEMKSEHGATVLESHSEAMSRVKRLNKEERTEFWDFADKQWTPNGIKPNKDIKRS